MLVLILIYIWQCNRFAVVFVVVQYGRCIIDRMRIDGGGDGGGGGGGCRRLQVSIVNLFGNRCGCIGNRICIVQFIVDRCIGIFYS